MAPAPPSDRQGDIAKISCVENPVPIMSRTRFGREIYAAGGNPEASRLMGVNVERIQLILYIASGAVAAIAGIILAAMLGAASSNAQALSF